MYFGKNYRDCAHRKLNTPTLVGYQMHYKEIRAALIEKLPRENFPNPEALLVEELGWCEGESLLNLALVTNHNNHQGCHCMKLLG